MYLVNNLCASSFHLFLMDEKLFLKLKLKVEVLKQIL